MVGYGDGASSGPTITPPTIECKPLQGVQGLTAALVRLERGPIVCSLRAVR